MALTKEEIKRKMTELFHEVEDITKVDGVDNLPGCEGMLIYEEPLIGFASADDPLFEEYKKPHVIGENYLTPREWLEDTETIISFFLPFREEIRKPREMPGCPERPSEPEPVPLNMMSP